MPWVRIDDHFSEHPKLARVTPLLWGYWLAGLAYCNRNLTDGFIPQSIAQRLGDVGPDPDSVIAKLVDVGLWEGVEDGYRVHDYCDYQPTRKRVLGERKRAASRQRKHRNHTVTSTVSHAVTPPVTHRPVTTAPTPTPTVTSDEVTSRLCRLLAEQIRSRDPSAKVAPQSKTWLDEARRLIERDGRSVEEIEDVIRWLPSHNFWPTVVLSMPKLRDKFTQLVAAKSRENGASTSHLPEAQRPDGEWMAQAEAYIARQEAES